MRVNPEYLKGLLEAFELAEKPYTYISELERHGYSYKDHECIFHLDILCDKGLIESKSEDGSLGFSYSPSEGVEKSFQLAPLRLTADGHDFIANLNEKDVWHQIKENFQESGFDTIKSVAADLAMGYAKKKVGALLAA
tara:strand:- start:928 stop:1341 length:414 start_codon:yes stop_codon:yes gene_type:complete